MSLKGFHVFFIIVAALFCVLTAVWAFLSSESTGVIKGFGAFCGLAGLALTAYGVWFVKKKSKTIIT